MPNIPSFSEDMLPRHFPRSKRPPEQNSAVVPVPTLPGVSLLLDEENKVPQIEPKKSFQKWKQQNEAMFASDATDSKAKSDKKQVRFQASNVLDGYFKQRRPLPAKSNPPASSPKLELSFYESTAHTENVYSQKHHHNPYKSSNIIAPITDIVNSGVNSKVSQLMRNQPNGLQNMIHFSQFNRAVRSEALKEDCSSNIPVYDHQQAFQIPPVTHINGHCCQSMQHVCKGVDRQQPVIDRCQSCSHEYQNNHCVQERRSLPLNTNPNEFPCQHDTAASEKPPPTEQQLVNATDLNRDGKSELPLDDDTLISIMEEQQQHILMQQNQILMQQKQILMQQNQIFILQHQMEKLLLRCGSAESQSSNLKLPPTTISEMSPSSPGVVSNALAMRNGTSRATNGTTNRTSIGVMTSFIGNMNDGGKNEVRQFNERFTATTKFTNERGGIPSNDQSYKDSMLDRINEVLRNSPAVIDYQATNGTNRRMSPSPKNRMSPSANLNITPSSNLHLSPSMNRRTSPSKPADINIAAQALIYESSSNGFNNDPKITDRSFALYMLGMKYCPQDDVSSADKQGPDLNNQMNRDHLPLNTESNDQISVNISPDAYDYLIRHGLLKK